MDVGGQILAPASSPCGKIHQKYLDRSLVATPEPSCLCLVSNYTDNDIPAPQIRSVYHNFSIAYELRIDL